MVLAKITKWSETWLSNSLAYMIKWSENDIFKFILFFFKITFLWVLKFGHQKSSKIDFQRKTLPTQYLLCVSQKYYFGKLNINEICFRYIHQCVFSKLSEFHKTFGLHFLLFVKMFSVWHALSNLPILQFSSFSFQKSPNKKVKSSRGGLEVELWTDNSLPSASVDRIPLWVL